MMRGTRAHKAIGLILLAGVATAPLGGCETVQRETGLSKETQTGALGGAAFGGIIAALAGANPAWIAGSILLGGAAGGVIGNSLGKRDAQQHAENNLQALDTLGRDQSSSWRDEQTGNSGSTRVNSVTTSADGTVCKAFTETVKTGTRTVTQDAQACKVPGGRWEVQTG